MNGKAMRMPPLQRDSMDEVQRAAADELIAGPRKGVKGPFIALLRSPDLMARLQKVGEYLRFNSKVPQRLSEFATLVVSRDWSQQFEWFTHVPLALKAGVLQETIDALRDGRRPTSMAADEALVYDFVTEMCARRGVSDATYKDCLDCLGEQGVLDLVGIVGYFTLISMVLNVARIPEEPNAAIEPMPALPL
jgi:4-carboxymuconolactone decarboxylase